MRSGSIVTQVRPHGLKLNENFSFVIFGCSVSEYQSYVFWSDQKISSEK